jgi:hypothetical protein
VASHPPRGHHAGGCYGETALRLAVSGNNSGEINPTSVLGMQKRTCPTSIEFRIKGLGFSPQGWASFSSQTGSTSLQWTAETLAARTGEIQGLRTQLSAVREQLERESRAYGELRAQAARHETIARQTLARAEHAEARVRELLRELGEAQQNMAQLAAGLKQRRAPAPPVAAPQKRNAAPQTQRPPSRPKHPPRRTSSRKRRAGVPNSPTQRSKDQPKTARVNRSKGSGARLAKPRRG